ncbi:leucine--tRNA ligase [Candidatus Giovannonibacteria bacterium RIFCSPLOWO2_01_FULL_44_40]|uniref:Leucine--tRNA ligase n=1 Tax=Candidatus Giovannonibacteria bacterium RIFCSPHIGHO2_01_FULL_45_23 TaxID=1798325 RepID=A0A1F5VEM1_9BACT|nr:MAG: leucine--tRNA ligase [Candidatus Giovannonibacteria bacterium RIFCSPHIGHO2_01_FULL_45_23]OGF76473.1 MAG: leucine--tRNA ligase [Candidatus Giovannonibacteria bacterium RIFCSPHIGHO2_02_FULL_45_13]OGF79600.1 MAG: leucine--tRNA ligase [Candidatus Giovannonibacteria bacterium RIFCSPLOWO2_01_FULL_44_40]
MPYDHKKIEKKWQKEWAKNNFAEWHAEDFGAKQKKYVLDMFPYPSGEGLHVGHLVGYVGSDIASRYFRMNGFNVLHPMGWDAFGLPAENYAIKNKIHPRIAVEKNIKNFKKQLNSVGFSYDWSREINTTDPDYYKWTQWIFLQLFKSGLAYEADLPVNWCVSCKTVLANEEVKDGACDRCGSAVLQKNMRQWALKITAYADRLLEDLDGLDWPEPIKEMQRNWIGKSEGAEIEFKINPPVGGVIKVFTTRPDTLFGATYVVLAPENPLIQNLESRIQNLEEVEKYITQSKKKTQLQRQKEEKEKTGVELKGIKAINPANGEEIPVWVADYVLMSYGTGAIMAVPKHDERDREFAEKFKLPIVDMPLVNKDEIVKKVGGKKQTQYRLRDWIFSRQRYWGEPIPIIKCPKCGNVAVPENDLPVKLPEVKNYKPTGTGESPLAAVSEWVNVNCPQCGGKAKRETNTMPQWAGSCWYYLAYVTKARNSKFEIRDSDFKRRARFWLPVDLYIGGVEHAVLHLLYARFWHKFLYDIGVAHTKEPFQKLLNQGLVLGPDGQKMSKSRGNVISPNETIEKFGADALRMYEMFMSPFGDQKPWDPKSIVGLRRFLDRVWKFGQHFADIDSRVARALNQTIKKVGEDIEEFHFNTAISALMILLNEMEKRITHPLASLELRRSGPTPSQREGENGEGDFVIFLKLLAPFAPHLTEEIWSKLGNKSAQGRPASGWKSIHLESWPEYDPKLVEEEAFQLIVQINGKVRDKFEAPVNISQSEAERLTLAREKVKLALENRKPRKVVWVPKRLINLVV